MTPYYWKTPVSGSQAIAAAKTLDTEIEFHFLVYRKEAE
jgi:23S rRNA (guanine745-N1)-methyltransferase